MGKYLKLFNNHTQYETFKNSTNFVRPNVSHCILENDVHYSPIIVVFATFVGKVEGEYVDGISLYFGGMEEYGGTKANAHFQKIVVDSTIIEGDALDTCNLGIEVAPAEIHNVTYYLKEYNTSGCFNSISMESIVFPEGMVSINSNTFFYTYVKHVILPESLTTIENNGFDVVWDLDSVTIPKNVTSIGNGGLWGTIKEIIMLPTIPPTLGVNAIDNTDIEHIYVPAESVNAYKTANRWSSFASKIEAIPTS